MCKENITEEKKVIKLERINTWLGKYKDTVDIIIKTAGILIAIGSLTMIYCQIRGITKQNEAIWYSNRPALRIFGSDPKKDIKPFSGEIKTSNGYLSDSTLFSVFYYKIENVGNTPAEIDTIYYELFNKDTLLADTIVYATLPLSPKDKVVEKMNLCLRVDKTNIFKITIIYNWEKSINASNQFSLNKYYVANFDKDNWSIKIQSSEDYKAKKERFLSKGIN